MLLPTMSKLLTSLASRRGLEPLTPGLGNLCSILLSYRDPVDASAGKTTRTVSKMTAGDKPDIDASLDRIEPVAWFSPSRITRFRKAGGARRALAPLWAPPWDWLAAARPRRLAGSPRAPRRSRSLPGGRRFGPGEGGS